MRDLLGSRAARNPELIAKCEFQPEIDRLRAALNASLRGKEQAVELVLACLLAQGHLLIEDLPGLGKTTLAKALARAVGGTFARVQCTPDLLPGDITGFTIFNQRTREFEFNAGPVFSHVFLADEINRATPRTQSALFEAMAERQVTVDKVTRPLPETFFVIATQNPVESHGTFPLPEAQLDRFAVKLSLGYPDRRSEILMLAEDDVSHSMHPPPEPVLMLERLAVLQRQVAEVHVSERVQAYLVDLAAATRRHRQVHLGASPRATLIWQRLAKAFAHLAGRDFVTPDDVHAVARPALEVRLVGDFESAGAVIDEILAEVPVPVLG